MKRYWLLIFLLASLGLAVNSAQDRSAMVVQTKGNNKVTVEGKTQRLRTLQVLPQDATVVVPKGCTLRLSYFREGRKETITGPCKLTVGFRSSTQIGGLGKIRGKRTRGVKEVVTSKSLRRMGGALQANAGQAPGDMLAMVNFKKADPPPPPPQSSPAPIAPRSKAAAISVEQAQKGGGARKGSSQKETLAQKPKVPKPGAMAATVERRPGPLRAVGIPSVYVRPPANRTLEWAGPAGDYKVVLSRGEKTLYSKEGPALYLRCAPAVLGPGRSYILKVTHPQSKQSFEKEFYILSSKEKDEAKAEYDRLSEELNLDDDAPHAILLSWLDGEGFLLEARKELEKSVKLFPDNSGFHAALGRTLINLGMYKEAKKSLLRAKNLER